MNEPILEALTFSLNTGLQVDDVRVESSDIQLASTSWHLHKPPPGPKNSKSLLPSSVILGENLNTPCLIQGCQYISEEPLAQTVHKDNFLAHLLSEHRIVIDDVDKIANLHKYVIYWKERFISSPITDFCVGFVMDEIPIPPERFTKKVVSDSESDRKLLEKNLEKPKYYMLTPALQEDKDFRSKLWTSRLEAVLEVNRQEREQQDFSRQCFFCREIFTGNRSVLFEHMKTDHSFHIGKPDNIVFVEEFMEIIFGKLNELICLHCEKIFKDKAVLRDHMRKKGHKRLNSNNPEYNRYYTVNYLEPGKDWKALDEEEPEDDRIEEDWIEANEESPSIVCLFCSQQSFNFEDILEHMINQHSFDFLRITSQCDFYQKVKIVNFIRRTVFLNTCLYCEKKFLEKTNLVKHILEHTKTNKDSFPTAKTWDQPEYYFPTYENDQFLVLLDKDNNAEDDQDSVISSEDEVPVFAEDPMTLSSPPNLGMF